VEKIVEPLQSFGGQVSGLLTGKN